MNQQPSFVNEDSIKLAEQIISEAALTKAACIATIEKRLQESLVKSESSGEQREKEQVQEVKIDIDFSAENKKESLQDLQSDSQKTAAESSK